MPHAVIERSENLVPDFIEHDIDLVDLVHGVLIETGLFDVSAIKTREITLDNWMVGDKGQDGSFVHVSVAIKSGRSVEQKQNITNWLITALSDYLVEIEIDEITVELRELDNDTYRKSKKAA